MYIITTMSYPELGTLIRDKRVSLNNASFGYQPNYYKSLLNMLNPASGEDSSQTDVNGGKI